jgi:hypothetical protein
VLPIDERPEELRVGKVVRQLNASEADHVAVVLGHAEGLLGRRVPIAELRFKILRGRPDRVAEMLFRAHQRVAREGDDGVGVRAAEATQAAVHEAPAGRTARSRARRST